MVATASTAPAAPSKCPIMDLVELILRGGCIGGCARQGLAAVIDLVELTLFERWSLAEAGCSTGGLGPAGARSWTWWS